MGQQAIPVVFIRGGTSKALMLHTRDLPRTGTILCCPAAMRERPPFILTANGPNSSIEKNASSAFRPDRMPCTRATFST